MNQDVDSDNLEELRKLAEAKLESLVGLVSKADYDYLLDLMMMEIGLDIGINYKAKFLLDAETGMWQETQ